MARHKPEDGRVTELLAEVYHLNGKQDEASRLYQELAKQHRNRDAKVEAIHYYEKALLCTPRQYFLYTILANLYSDRRRKLHLFIYGMLTAGKKNLIQAKKFYERTCSLNIETDLAHLAYLQLLHKKKDITGKSKETGVDEPKEKYAVYRTLLDFYVKWSSDPKIQEERIFCLEKLIYWEKDVDFEVLTKELKQVNSRINPIHIYRQWLNLIIQRRDWEWGKEIAIRALKETGESSPLLEQLYFISQQREDQAEELGNIALRLGRTYYAEKKWAKAEKFCRTAQEKAPSFASSFALAECLQEQGKISESVQCYYSASEMAYQEKAFGQVSRCLARAAEIDPTYSNLSSLHRQMFLTHRYVVEIFDRL